MKTITIETSNHAEFLFDSHHICLLSFLLVLTCAVSLQAASGYDENTQVVISGTVKQIQNRHPSGFKCIVVQSYEKEYKILTAPEWYARKVGLNFRAGAKVQVVGSKFYTSDGNIYLMARSIKSLDSGRYVTLRDKQCHPLWHGIKGHGESCMRIFFNPDQQSF